MSLHENEICEDRCYEKFLDMYDHEYYFRELIQERFSSTDDDDNEEKILADAFDILWNWDSEGMYHSPRSTALSYHKWKLDQERKTS